ncbi:Cell death-related nuclease 6 [Holothuria leucospilota]|uniref:Cell death-related nuclease 6 n=1 Tax=Holothuria leucospilota TaxID=206669 RepID=A0A9Q1HBC7_HOLLE|nr:Cell death-related nuclease 6 [Holothuria leucospilota]
MENRLYRHNNVPYQQGEEVTMLRTTVVIELCLLLIVCEVVYIAGVTCKDANGNNVDWYYVYKLPKIPNNPHSLIKKGVAFYYLDNNQQTFRLSDTSMEEEDSHPVAETLQQIYDQHETVTFSVVLLDSL